MEHFSGEKFAMGYEKNMSFLVMAKSPKVWGKNEKIGLSPFFVLYTASAHAPSKINYVVLIIQS